MQVAELRVSLVVWAIPLALPCWKVQGPPLACYRHWWRTASAFLEAFLSAYLEEEGGKKLYIRKSHQFNSSFYLSARDQYL